jgi:hypothetical protein
MAVIMSNYNLEEIMALDFKLDQIVERILLDTVREEVPYGVLEDLVRTWSNGDIPDDMFKNVQELQSLKQSIISFRMLDSVTRKYGIEEGKFFDDWISKLTQEHIEINKKIATFWGNKLDEFKIELVKVNAMYAKAS